MNKENLVEALKKGMSYMTEQEKMVLILTYYEELNIVEVMSVLDIDEYTYQKLLTNAKTKMRPYTDIFDKIDQMNN